FALLRPAFLNVDLTLIPIQGDISVFAVVGIAQLCVLSLGHMNLAVGRIAAVSAFATALVCDRGAPLWLGLVVGLIVGAGIGALAGWTIAATGVNSFIVTLALDFALLGLVALLYSWFTESGIAFSAQPAGLGALQGGTLRDDCVAGLCGPPVPLVVLFAIAAVAIAGLVFSRLRLGRELLMTGSSLRAAELSGIAVSRRIVQAHAMSGCFAALGGFLLAVNNGAITADIGNQFLLPSFLSPVLGGTALAGGAVSVIGNVLGAGLTEVIQKGLNLLQFSADELQILIGVVLLAALSLDRVRHVLAERQASRV
ncbi:MAG: ribose transport system permease protein, partial [Gaiellaceae bacterium]|nr:ribose transport system permease protein [Gaiellaceae bacterium]